ncbi:MAG TPA: hypothetical protein VGX24_12285 [Pyrinomonadaceae bacterium]|jgi:uncharacterized protein YdeI (BOF family)|nr:hypothetical protein [Pyrinomonadaceae bacterium]
MLKPQPQRFTSRAVTLALAAFFCAGTLIVAVAAQRNAGRARLPAPEVVSIAAARALPPGALVTIEGSVTVPSGAFKSGTSDEGFAMQDGSGGIYVRTAANLGLRVGRRVRVSGRLADSNGQLILVPARASDVRARGRGTNIRAEAVSTGQINEATEGRLVQVTGTITKPVGNDLPYGYRLFIDDGSGEIQAFIYVSTGIDVRGLQPGQRVGVTGFGGQYNDHYEIIPRFQSDIRRTR